MKGRGLTARQRATAGAASRGIGHLFRCGLAGVARLGGLGALWFGTPCAALELTHVQANTGAFQMGKGERASVRYDLSEPGRVLLSIYDDRDLLIRSVDSGAVQPAGEHALEWDGNDQAGRPVPAEAYRYTLTATAPNGGRVEHDLSDLTGGQILKAQDVAWDPVARQIRYRLSEPARVSIRIGLKNNGPLLATVLDWGVRDVGLHTESWDAWDSSHVIDLSRHPDLDILIDAYSLSANALIVGPAAGRSVFVESLSWGQHRRERKRILKKRMHFHAQQPAEGRGDVAISLDLVGAAARTSQGLPIVSGQVPVRLDIATKDRDRLLAQRFEPIFYVDGTFAFENEVGYAPMTWIWDTQGVNPGEHLITGNVRGYEGNFGMATIKVYVDSPTNAVRRGVP